jgi:hypothetical protein
MIAFDNHVHALDHIAVIVPIKCDDSLEPENVRTVDLGDLLDPGEKPFRVERAGAKGNRLDGQIMNCGGRCVIVFMVVTMIMLVVMAVMIVAVVMIAIRGANMVRVIVIEKMRIIVERTAQVEGAAVQNGIKCNRSTLGAVNARRGIDRADDAFDGFQFFS